MEPVVKKNIKNTIVAGTAAVFGGAALLGAAAPAQAADKWDQLVECEASGDWSANTGNGFSGGLQFTQSTWKAYGGGQYASNAKDASREEQIQVAEKVLQAQGTKAWPGCSSKTSWSSGSSDSSSSKSSSAKSSSSSDSSEKSKSSSAKQSKSSSVRSKGADYTVQQGDTLGKIAQKYGVKYQDVFERNSNTLKDPNTIFPGQQLEIR